MTDAAARTRRTLEYVRVDTLVPDPRNPKAHAEKDLRASLDRWGYTEPMVIDERTGQLVAGHGRAEALAELRRNGKPPPAGIDVDADGMWLAPVIRGWASRDDREAGAYLVAANRLTEKGGWHDDPLASLLSEVADAGDAGLLGVGFDRAELDDLLASLAPPEDEPEPAPRPPPGEHPADPVTRLGDVWALGPHRLVCGSAFDPELRALAFGDLKVGAVLTDPPYGIALDTDYNHLHWDPIPAKSYPAVAGDDRPFDASELATFFDGVAEQWWFGANWYRRTLPEADLVGSWLVWDKRPTAWTAPAMDDVMGAGFELIWSRQYHQQRMLRYLWTGFTARNRGLPRIHPTEKPIELLVDILGRWTKPGIVVADPFAGSGTLLLAAERIGRTAALMELEPAYCDAICRRWQKASGGVLPVAADGTPHPFPDS